MVEKKKSISLLNIFLEFFHSTTIQDQIMILPETHFLNFSLVIVQCLLSIQVNLINYITNSAIRCFTVGLVIEIEFCKTTYNTIHWRYFLLHRQARILHELTTSSSYRVSSNSFVIRKTTRILLLFNLSFILFFCSIVPYFLNRRYMRKS